MKLGIAFMIVIAVAMLLLVIAAGELEDRNNGGRL